jgi:hypothetical protein
MADVVKTMPLNGHIMAISCDIPHFLMGKTMAAIFSCG